MKFNHFSCASVQAEWKWLNNVYAVQPLLLCIGSRWRNLVEPRTWSWTMAHLFIKSYSWSLGLGSQPYTHAPQPGYSRKELFIIRKVRILCHSNHPFILTLDIETFVYELMKQTNFGRCFVLFVRCWCCVLILI